jgi:hypothetical protein
VNAPVNHSRVSALNPASGSMPAWAPAVLAPSGAGAAVLIRVFAGMHPSCLALRTIQPGYEKHRMNHRTAHGWQVDCHAALRCHYAVRRRGGR